MSSSLDSFSLRVVSGLVGNADVKPRRGCKKWLLTNFGFTFHYEISMATKSAHFTDILLFVIICLIIELPTPNIFVFIHVDGSTGP